MEDNLSKVYGDFFEVRAHKLSSRFPGTYRAVVVETNDPLQLHRIRFKCPELHDSDLKPEECPWALPSPKLGSKNAGSWESPIIGDVVFIQFEKDHPYGPIWTGFAMGTRRKRYPLESIFTESPLSVDEKGKPADRPADYISEYLPKDRRPMSTGWRDRYGNAEVNSAVGFFPIEHAIKPAPEGADGVSRQDFKTGAEPKVNNPDKKYLAKMTKYGTYVVQADVGYYWKSDGDTGEFSGDADKDRPFEIDRYKYLTKLLNENEPDSKNRDQRRYEIRTRAGHKFEIRDVGYAQAGGAVAGAKIITDAKSRVEEGQYGGKILSVWGQTDERWMKMRTKGGHLIEAIDIGFHPEKDEFYGRKLIEECGANIDDSNWTKRDARQIRFVTRWGSKFVLDDRDTHPRSADKHQSPRGNGWLTKTRRDWQPDVQANQTGGRGFGFEAIDKDALNTTRWYTPKSKIIEMNDRKDYIMVCTDTKSEISREWGYLSENEFATKIAMTEDPEKDTYHLKLDKRNGYIRLKTAAGNDNDRRVEPEPENFIPTGEGADEMRPQDAPGQKMKLCCWPDGSSALPQGLECRDGGPGFRGNGDDGPWAELVDLDHRGIWFSRRYGLGIWRSAQGLDQFIMIYDRPVGGSGKPPAIVIRNNEDGPIQIYCKKNVEIISNNDVSIQAKRDISLKAGRNIKMQGEIISGMANTMVNWNSGENKVTLKDGKLETNTIIIGQFVQGSGGLPALEGNMIEIVDQNPREPKDRSKVENSPFDEVQKAVIGPGAL